MVKKKLSDYADEKQMLRNYDEYYEASEKPTDYKKYYKIKQLLRYYNFYYIHNKSTSKNKYLIISPAEYSMIQNYYRDRKIENKKITIKNKFGVIVEPSYIRCKNKKINSRIDIEEIFVQFLLGKDLSYFEYIDMFDYFYNNNINKSKINDIITCFEENYNTKFYNNNMITLFNKSKTLNELLTYIEKMDAEEFLELFTYMKVTIPEPLLPQIMEIKNYRQAMKGGHDEKYYYVKYMKYKIKYLGLK